METTEYTANTDGVMVVIPSLNPEHRFIDYIKELQNAGLNKMIVVDDGSDITYRDIYDELEKMDIIVFRHGVNCGKGRALKTAFNYILVKCPKVEIVVTADSDGTYLAADVLNTALQAKENTITLGARDYKNESIALANRKANTITYYLLKLLGGITMNDTQTGLRAYPRSLLGYLLTTPGERYDYEFNMIFDKKDIQLQEIAITPTPRMSVKRTHFRALKDSWNIVGAFLLFIFVSLSSTILDLAIYSVGISLLEESMPLTYIAVSTFIGRVFSDTYNYYLDKYLVFKADEISHVGRYMLLATGKTVASAILVSILVFLFRGGEMPIKLVIDMLIFFVGYRIEKHWVYEK